MKTRGSRSLGIENIFEDCDTKRIIQSKDWAGMDGIIEEGNIEGVFESVKFNFSLVMSSVSL